MAFIAPGASRASDRVRRPPLRVAPDSEYDGSVRATRSGWVAVDRLLDQPERLVRGVTARREEPPTAAVEVHPSYDLKHPLERHPSPLGGVGVHRDLVDDPARHQLLEHPAKVGRVDAEHRGARAHERVERDDRLAWAFVVQSIHEVDLGADGDDRSDGGGVDGADDEVGV